MMCFLFGIPNRNMENSDREQNRISSTMIKAALPTSNGYSMKLIENHGKFYQLIIFLVLLLISNYISLSKPNEVYFQL
jgi:hypothetical protein